MSAAFDAWLAKFPDQERKALATKLAARVAFFMSNRLMRHSQHWFKQDLQTVLAKHYKQGLTTDGWNPYQPAVLDPKLLMTTNDTFCAACDPGAHKLIRVTSKFINQDLDMDWLTDRSDLTLLRNEWLTMYILDCVTDLHTQLGKTKDIVCFEPPELFWQDNVYALKFQAFVNVLVKK